MRDFRGSFRLVSCLALLGLVPSSASAQLLVAAEPGAPNPIEHAELAYALGDGPPVTWVSLHVARGPVALVAALPEGALADAGLDAWLQALQATASPRVLVPRALDNCGEPNGSVQVGWERSSGAPPDELRLDRPEDVENALALQGLSLEAALPSASAYVVWSWPELEAPETTRTLRVQGGAAPLAFLPGSPFPVLVSALTRGALQLAEETHNGALDVTFFAGDVPETDYRVRLDAWLDARSEPVLEARSRGLLFDWTVRNEFSIAPLVRSYAVFAQAELPELDGEACSRALRALRVQTSLEADVVDCGAARDAGFALQAVAPDLATLQRFVVSAARGVDPAELVGGGEPRAPALRAKTLDDSGCKQPPQPPVVVEPTPSRPSPVVQPPAETEVVTQETFVVEEHHTTEVDCGGAPQPERDERDYWEDDTREGSDCSSDTSSSSEPSSSDGSCSGDTSTSSESDSGSEDDVDGSEDEADCASDSSSSSSASSDDEADCSSDTSSSTSADGGDADCDGGPGDGDSDYQEDDDGYDGDTCAGDAAPDRATQKSQAGLARGKRVKRAERLKTSLWSVAFAAVVLPIRRRKRRARAAS